MAMTKAQRRIQKMAALAAEQAEYEKRVKAATKRAAYARCEAVEQLYEILAISEEPTTARTTVRDGEEVTVQVTTDKDESKRAIKLVAAVEAILAELDGLRAAPAEPSPKAQTESKWGDGASVGAEA